jgi:hypothetical protein
VKQNFKYLTLLLQGDTPFVSPETPSAVTAKTIKTSSGSFVSGVPRRFQPSKVGVAEEQAHPTDECCEAPTALTKPSEHLIEATFRVATEGGSAQTGIQFPQCPVCGATRYWISRGLVLCGSKRCASAPRFVLTSLEFHAVQ